MRFDLRLVLSVCLLGLAVGLLSNCSGPRRAELPTERPALFPDHTLLQIQAAVSAAADTLHAFTSRSNVRMDTPEQRGSFNIQLRQRRSDSLAASITVGPGIRVAQGLVTPDSFFVYDRVHRRLYYNSVAQALDAIPAPLTTYDLFGNLLGLVPTPFDPEWSVRADTAFYYLEAPDRRVRYSVDPRIWRVNRVEFLDDEGRLVEEREFTEYDLFDGVYLPRRITFNRPVDAQQVSLYHRSIKLNPTDLDLSFETGRISERILFP